MADASRAAHAAEFRDKRYSGQTLLVDLHDTAFEAASWSVAQFGITADPKSFPDHLAENGELTGVFGFTGYKEHGLFEAAIAVMDRKAGMLTARFTWINDAGRELLKTMAATPKTPMQIALAYASLNWSFTGFLLGGYRGDVKEGQRINGLIWADIPNDPGQFAGHAVHVDKERHTLAIQFDALPTDSFTLLERAMIKRHGGAGKPSGH